MQRHIEPYCTLRAVVHVCLSRALTIFYVQDGAALGRANGEESICPDCEALKAHIGVTTP
jgi:hypothetical protein